jgi:SnoaL-like protein
MDRRQFVSAIPVAVGTGSIAVAEAYAQTANGSDTAAASDEVAIASVVTGERWARDMAQWDIMQAAYHPGAIVDISWISGPAAEFVAQSKQHYERGTRSLHLLGPVLVKVNGDRATADAGAQILIPGSVRGVGCLTQSYCRIVERLERRGGRWAIVLLQTIYQMETISRRTRPKRSRSIPRNWPHTARATGSCPTCRKNEERRCVTTCRGLTARKG